MKSYPNALVVAIAVVVVNYCDDDTEDVHDMSQLK